MEGFENLPPWVIPTIGGVILFMVVMMVVGMRKSFARARNATGNMFASLERLGLQKTEEEDCKLRWDGQYRGRRVAMMFDSTAMQKAGKKAMRSSLMGAAKEGAGMAGIGGGGGGGGGGGWNDFKEARKERKIRNSIQNAVITMKWAVVLPLQSPVALDVSHDAEDGQQIAKGLYGEFDEAARQALSNPQVHAAMHTADFDLISVAGNVVLCTWAPQMREYQKHAATPEGFGSITQRALDAITTLSDALYGPAH